MTKHVVNLTEQFISGEIENQLESYPDFPYKKAFSIPELKQKLIAYVLNRVHSFYVVLDECDPSATDCHPLKISSHDLSKIASVIRDGIDVLMVEEGDQIETHICQPISAGLAPSTWFG